MCATLRMWCDVVEKAGGYPALFSLRDEIIPAVKESPSLSITRLEPGTRNSKPGIIRGKVHRERRSWISDRRRSDRSSGCNSGGAGRSGRGVEGGSKVRGVEFVLAMAFRYRRVIPSQRLLNNEAGCPRNF